MHDEVDELRRDLDIAIIIPCHDEEATIGDLVHAARRALPHARIIVIDNASSDLTAMTARMAGAEVRFVKALGKGRALNVAFSAIDADIYVVMDGDGTYRPEEAGSLIKQLTDSQLDMVVGCRENIYTDAGRRGHATGNRLFSGVFSFIFGERVVDLFSGYRVFTRRFVKCFPAHSTRFEIEAEMTVHAVEVQLPMAEIPVTYGRRPAGSSSKLSTVKDGLRITRTMLMMFKEYRPFLFFFSLSIFTMTLATRFAWPVLAEYFETGKVTRLPTWILSTSLMTMSALFLFCGIVLSSVARARIETKRLFSLNLMWRNTKK